MSRAAAKKANSRGVWEGSIVTEEHIEVLRYCRMIPSIELVAVRLPGGEGSTTPQDGEAVVFNEHFAYGFGLPHSVLDGASDTMKMTACSAALVHHQTASSFLKHPL
ncbi:hypothetical protein D1007_16850 [Hordeum vulgare]|nr:hypothetical protein D1007_16850 [Hordeum vulgare]